MSVSFELDTCGRRLRFRGNLVSKFGEFSKREERERGEIMIDELSDQLGFSFS